MKILIWCFLLGFPSIRAGLLLDARKTRATMIDMRGTPDTDGICKSTGFRRNSTDCVQFYRCVDLYGEGNRFVIFRFMCGPMAIFDERQSVCADPARAHPKCESSSTLVPATVPLPPPVSTANPLHESTPYIFCDPQKSACSTGNGVSTTTETSPVPTSTSESLTTELTTATNQASTEEPPHSTSYEGYGSDVPPTLTTAPPEYVTISDKPNPNSEMTTEAITTAVESFATETTPFFIPNSKDPITNAQYSTDETATTAASFSAFSTPSTETQTDPTVADSSQSTEPAEIDTPATTDDSEVLSTISTIDGPHCQPPSSSISTAGTQMGSSVPESTGDDAFAINCSTSQLRRYPLDCSKFYECQKRGGGHILRLYSCTAHLVFDEVIAQCMHPHETAPCLTDVLKTGHVGN